MNENREDSRIKTQDTVHLDDDEDDYNEVDTSRICTRSDIIVKILRWMPQWLDEQKNQRDEPEVEGKGWQLNPVPSVYSSFKDYCNVVYPLMLHELWSSVFRDYSDQQAAVPSLGLKRPPILACLTEQSTSSRRT